jgi:hypothetical protein
MSPTSATERNTARNVVAIRLSPAERAQIVRAAGGRDLPVSTFIRWAATEAASEQLLRAARPKAPAPAPHAPERETIMLGDEPAGHWVDGELVTEKPWRPHSFEGETCSGCGLAISDVRGRDLPCDRKALARWQPLEPAVYSGD